MTYKEISEKKVYGDYKTLAKMLGVDKDVAKMRFLRGNEEAVKAMEMIIESREQTINDFKEQTAKENA